MKRIRQASLAAVMTLALAGGAFAQSGGGGGGGGSGGGGGGGAGGASSGSSAGSAGGSAGGSSMGGSATGGISARGTTSGGTSTGTTTGGAAGSGAISGQSGAATGLGGNSSAIGSPGIGASGTGVTGNQPAGIGANGMGVTGAGTSPPNTNPAGVNSELGAGTATQGSGAANNTMRPSTGATTQPGVTGTNAPNAARCQAILSDRQSYDSSLVQSCSASAGDPASTLDRQLQPANEKAVNSICKGC